MHVTCDVVVNEHVSFVIFHQRFGHHASFNVQGAFPSVWAPAWSLRSVHGAAVLCIVFCAVSCDCIPQPPTLEVTPFRKYCESIPLVRGVP